MKTRIKYAKKVHFFKGDNEVTIIDAKGMWRSKTDIRGSADVKSIVASKEKLHRSRQYRVMEALGFVCKDKYGMMYDRGALRVVFYKSRVKELFMDGKPVESITVELER
jgi:hypothetical protein